VIALSRLVDAKYPVVLRTPKVPLLFSFAPTMVAAKTATKCWSVDNCGEDIVSTERGNTHEVEYRSVQQPSREAK